MGSKGRNIVSFELIDDPFSEEYVYATNKNAVMEEGGRKRGGFDVQVHKGYLPPLVLGYGRKLTPRNSQTPLPRFLVHPRPTLTSPFPPSPFSLHFPCGGSGVCVC